jgi:hypothetical protein
MEHIKFVLSVLITLYNTNYYDFVNDCEAEECSQSYLSYRSVKHMPRARRKIENISVMTAGPRGQLYLLSVHVASNTDQLYASLKWLCYNNYNLSSLSSTVICTCNRTNKAVRRSNLTFPELLNNVLIGFRKYNCASSLPSIGITE